jgi:hypothetical protein
MMPSGSVRTTVNAKVNIELRTAAFVYSASAPKALQPPKIKIKLFNNGRMTGLGGNLSAAFGRSLDLVIFRKDMLFAEAVEARRFCGGVAFPDDSPTKER